VWYTVRKVIVLKHHQGRRNRGRAEGEIKVLRAKKTYKNKKMLPIMLYSATLTSKIITKIRENHSEVSGRAAINLFHFDFHKP